MVCQSENTDFSNSPLFAYEYKCPIKSFSTFYSSNFFLDKMESTILMKIQHNFSALNTIAVRF